MNMRRWVIAGLVVVLVGVFLGTVMARAEGTAPDFSLKDTTGKTVTLSALKGKVVFLDFWASWCPPCRMSIPKVQQLYETFKGSNVAVLGINVENDADTAAAFAQKEHLSYTVLVGNEKVERDYRISGIPGFFIIDANGKILQKFEGYYPGLENQWAKIIREGLAKPAGKKPIKR